MRLQRLAAGFGISVAALGLLSTPAQAAPSDVVPTVEVEVPQQIAVIAGHTKSVRAEVYNSGTVEAKGVYLKFGSAKFPVDPSVGFVLPKGCDDNGCTVGDLAPGAHETYTFTLSPSAQTAENLKSTFAVTVGGATGVIGDEAEVTVVRAAGGIDLEVGSIDDMTLNRGQAKNVPVVVSNAGSKDVDGIGLIFIGQEGLEAVSKYRNCEVDNSEGIASAVCEIDQKFPAGAVYTLPAATPLQVKLASDAGGPYTYGAALAAVGLTASTQDELAAKAAGSTGPTLKLQATDGLDGDIDDDLNPDDNVVAFGVKAGRSVADSAAAGATFSGSVGDVRTVKVGVRNLGPTTVVPLSDDWVQTVRVTVPTGITLSKVDKQCLPGTDINDDDLLDKLGQVDGRVYTCLVFDSLGVNQQALFSFTGKIGDGAHTGGTVVADGGVQDSNKANNTAAIKVEVKSTVALAVTGTPTGWVALGGALLLIAGIVTMLVVRRRRIVTVA